MRDKTTDYFPLRGINLLKISLNEGQFYRKFPSLRDFSYLCIINQTSTSYDRNETL